MRKKIKIALLLIVALSIIYCILIYAKRMTGTVVDAETGKPIEGAVVLVEWTWTKGFGLTYTTSYKVTEMVTNKNGQFKIYGVVNPFVNEPDVTVYKKGYVAWSSRWIFPGMINRIDYKWGDSVFKLEHFKEGYSYIDHTSFIRSSINSSMNLEAKQKIYHSFDWEDQLSSKEIDQKTIKK